MRGSKVLVNFTRVETFGARQTHWVSATIDLGVIVILYDEDQRMGGLAPKNGLASGGHIPCALLSPLVRPGDTPT